MRSHDAQPPAQIRVLEVPDKTLWTAGGIQGCHVGPQSPVWGRPHPRAAAGPPPGAAVGCSSEHPPWPGGGPGSGQREASASPRPSSKGPGPRAGGGGSDSQGHEEGSILRSVHDGLQVVNPTDQEKACEGEEQRARWQVGMTCPNASGPGPRQAPGGRDGASPGPRARRARPGEGTENKQCTPCSQGSKPRAPATDSCRCPDL